ncbi:YciI family protein [Candidatus Entotheonella palauensis]|uniref:YCII-related domain-containing protein n=1 Tax=Candidatus Entotheonella gemina TaxID=1429439 RepID=W4MCY8_9BACT|nr:YciI family protein [Candidatus Entotheonella palauensis]ETX08204.1 MAG: hypothetical protein ETSY2_06770 [Candidatus Entotheonella gemina]
MAEFMLIMHRDTGRYAVRSPEERQQVLAEYAAWRMELEKHGHYLDANKLTDHDGRYLSFHNGEVRVVDGPYAEAKEIMGGYLIFRAADYDEAVKIASRCPHLKHGWRLELREVGVIPEPQF